MKRKTSGSRRKSNNQLDVTDSPHEVALVNKYGIVFYVFTPNIRKSNKEIKQIARLFDNRYTKPTHEELNAPLD